MKIQAGALALFLTMQQAAKGFVIPWETAASVNALQSSYMDKLSPGAPSTAPSTYSPFSNNKISGASGSAPGSAYSSMGSASPTVNTPAGHAAGTVEAPPPTPTIETPTIETTDTTTITVPDTTPSATMSGPVKSAKQEAIASKLTVLESELDKTKQKLGDEVERLTRQLAELLVEQTQVQQEQEQAFALEQAQLELEEAQAEEERRILQLQEEQEMQTKLKRWIEELQAQQRQLEDRARAEAAQLAQTRAEAAGLERNLAEKLAAMTYEVPPPPRQAIYPPKSSYQPSQGYHPSPHKNVSYGQPPDDRLNI